VVLPDRFPADFPDLLAQAIYERFNFAWTDSPGVDEVLPDFRVLRRKLLDQLYELLLGYSLQKCGDLNSGFPGWGVSALGGFDPAGLIIEVLVKPIVVIHYGQV